MTLQTFRSINSPEASRLIAAAFIALGISMTATVARSQQIIPFGDVPATADFSEAEIAARGQRKLPNLTYSTWKKLCFRGAQGADTKMVCRTSIEGKSDLALQLPFLTISESMGNHDSKIVDAGSVD
jgi:hypothetical protein